MSVSSTERRTSIISGGERISTVEVEQHCSPTPAVRAAAVVGVPDDQWGERSKGFVVLAVGASSHEA